MEAGDLRAFGVPSRLCFGVALRVFLAQGRSLRRRSPTLGRIEVRGGRRTSPRRSYQYLRRILEVLLTEVHRIHATDISRSTGDVIQSERSLRDGHADRFRCAY